MLEVARLEIELRFLDEARLPPFEGALVRGAFGYAFKAIACAGGDRCPPCKTDPPCAYAMAFEATPAPPPFDRNQQAARPYVIEPPERPGPIRAGEKLRVTLVLIGQAIPHFQLYLAALAGAGRLGVTARKSRYEITRVRSLDPTTHEEHELVATGGRALTGEPLVIRGPPEARLNGNVEIELLTPTRITFGGRLLTDDLPFPALVQALAIRLSMLDVVHCGGTHVPWRPLVDEALPVGTGSANLRWRQVGRYSTRREAHDTLSGIVGRVRYEGPNLARFGSLLRWGEVVHVGKKATFGLGRYRLVTDR